MHLSAFDIDIEALDHFILPTIAKRPEGRASNLRIFGMAFQSTERILGPKHTLRKANSTLHNDPEANKARKIPRR